ncbi:MAG: hypothetical protein IJ399_03560 [Bacilli bacterium]|nr:hypothetical protein [Bacilli bacterium]
MKIKIHDSTYIFLLLFFLAGYFECIYLLLIVILIHELGHCFFASLCGVKVLNILIYPFGGISILQTDINLKIYKEFLCLIGGILFQIIFFIIVRYLYLNSYVSIHVFSLFKRINYFLISFNFLPIIPLDGGKLLNLFFDLLFNYKLSFKITCFISILFSFIFLIYKLSFLSFLIFIFFIKSILFEVVNFKYKFNKFLLERLYKELHFKRYKFINNVNLFKRDCYHIINNEFESSFLKKYFNSYNTGV